MHTLIAIALGASLQLPAERPAGRLGLVSQATAIGLRLDAAAPPASLRGDSVKNGAIVGAVLGGAATGLFVGYLCGTFGTEDDNCAGGTLVWAGIGAAGGALLGAGIDALFDRRQPVRGEGAHRIVMGRR